MTPLVLLLVAAAPVRVLVAAGNDTGLADEPRLAYAAKDAARFREVFVALGDVEPERALLVTNQGPAAFLAALSKAASLAGSGEASLIVYYSGHGDASHLHLGGEVLELSEVERAMGRVQARLRLLVVDACRSVGRKKGLVPDEPFTISLDAVAGSRGAVTVRSSSEGESSQESDSLGGAVFTHYLLSALRGGADHDADGQVTLEEAYGYAYGRTLRRSAASSGPLQHPSLSLDVEKAGPMVLTRTGRASASVVLPPSPDVQYLVYQLPAGSVLAEVWGRPDRGLVVALPPGKFLVQRRGNGRYGAAEVALPYGGERALAEGDFAPLPLEALVEKGGALLVHPHQVSVLYSLAGGTAGLGHRARVRYGFVSSALALGAGAEVGQLSRRDLASDDLERWLGAEVFASLRIPLGPVEARAGAGGTARIVDQRLTSLMAERLAAAGYPGTESHTAFGAGPSAHLSAQVPLGERLWASVGFEGTALFLRRAGSAGAELSAALEVGVGWDL